MRRIAVVLTLLATTSVTSASAQSAEPVRDHGYITVSDGARLRYTVVRPAGDGPFPVALIWSVYTDGVGPDGGYPPAESPVIAGALLDAGYAVLGVNMRGTGCSGGGWDLFQPASDGYEVVEWAAAQDWSSGDVGMFGFSAPGISQLITAATKPPHLRAITPADVATDFYRDVVYPGGITNTSFMSFWMLGSRPGHQALSVPYATEQGDPACAAEIAGRPQPNDGWDLVHVTQHPYWDKTWDHYGVERILADIDVPLFTCQAWQDDQASSRAGSFWFDRIDNDRAWVVFTNGPHGTCDDYRTPYVEKVVAFFDRYVKGIENGFEDEPKVQVWHETSHSGDANFPSWVTNYPSWPVDVEPVTFHLRSGGTLDPAAPSGSETPDPYLYPLPSSSMEDNEYTVYTASGAGWQVPNAPLGFVAYTSEPLAADLEVFGPGSADLWIASTAPDTDLQITLTEIRPDGREQYVQRGWLRASHRTLDHARSTPLRPFHTHLRQDAVPLVPLEPAAVRIELNPAGHVLREGSALRLYVEAPTGGTGLWGLAFLPTPAVNQVLHDAEHPSRLVLGAVPGGSAAAPLPDCASVLSQPCRPAV